MSQPGDYYPPHGQPVLPGNGASDYERYLRTDELLSLQKPPAEMAHRDELLFQTVHQSSELWLKLACWEIEGATRLIQERDLGGAVRLLRRASHCMELIIDHITMLEHMSPWDYQSIRPTLGHGSGFGSPGFNRVNQVTPPLGDAFEALLRERGLTVVELYQRGDEFRDIYLVAEGVLDWDHRLTLWRVHHFKVVRRVIGGSVVGTAGTPVEVLGKLIHKQRFSSLWVARDELTEIAKRNEASLDGSASAAPERVHVD